MPTFAELAGAAPLQTVHGASLKPLWEGRGHRDFALNEWELLPTRTGVALSLRTVRTATHKLTVDLRSGAGELYDLRADPHELTNLWDRSVASGVQAELMAMIHSRPDDMRPIQTQVGIA
ncbi:sulfatase/phosphatase domain-containing protein [Tateyamaria sp. SN3-11]|uniref:sulfatase/phosphatase domain-containing protein n=1 Tax=Tateyamaria sp. SN3-11 TaxID=3092147 RepID=UPI0039EA38F5